VNPKLDIALTSVFLVSCVLCLYTIYAQDGFAVVVWFCLLFCCFLAAIQIVKMLSISAGRWFSTMFLSGPPFGNPLANSETMSKWADTCWQLLIHLSMSALDIYVLSDEEWFSDTSTCWNPHPKHQVLKPSLYMAYMFQLAIWVATGLSHRFVEERKHDYVVMFAHHIITILLLVASLVGRLHRIGILVLVVHDVSDISVDLLKLSNYLKLQNRPALFLGEIIFVLNLFIWMYIRLYVFPSRIIYSVLIQSHQFIGSFPECHEFACVCRSGGSVLLTILLMLHIWWFFLFLRIGFKIVFVGAHRAGELYEGRRRQKQ